MSKKSVEKKHPSSRVRGDAFFVRLEQLWSRVDAWANRLLPEHLNVMTCTGRAANLALVVAVASGVMMLFWYSPSLHTAHTSLEVLGGRSLGGWVRALHRYSSDLTLLLILVHALRMLVGRKAHGARWLPWVSGVGLLLLVWIIGWTGYWLVWDQPAREVAVTTMRFLDVLPVFGEPLGRLFVADRLVPSLLFFVVFFLHMLLPLLIGVGLVFHLSRVNRVKLLPEKPLIVMMVIALGVVALLAPAPLDAPATMGEKPEHFTVDAWYLTPLSLALRLSDLWLWAVPVLCVVMGMALPWLIGRRDKSSKNEAGEPLSKPWQTVVDVSRCHACTQCVQDCPYGAVTMVERQDNKPFAANAWVDPSRCVGCAVCVGSCDSEAMNLPWFPVRDVEGEILAKVEQIKKTGESALVALVAADIDGGMSYFRRKHWEKLLEGYLVEAVPTASWIRPRFIEKLLRYGAEGVFILRDPRLESAARDGNLWVEHRLQELRKPFYRPRLAGDHASSWQVVNYDFANETSIARKASLFRNGSEPVEVKPKRRLTPMSIGAALLLWTTLMALVVVPSQLQVDNPANPEPEFVLSFKAFGDVEEARTYSEDEDMNRPVHMRGRLTEKLRRHPVKVTVEINEKRQQREFTPKGISHDGPSLGEWRWYLPAGENSITVEIHLGGNSEILRWSGSLLMQERQIAVLTYEPDKGFILEE